MPLDDAFQAGTDAALMDMVQRPQAPRPAAPRFSLWNTLTAAPKGVAAGVADAIGSTADVLGAFGQALATTEPSAGGMFSVQSQQERQQSAAATDKLRKEGLDFMSEGGRAFRNVSRDYLPDPATAHGAEQAVGELFRIGSKALTAAAVLGPVPGAIASGAEEGFTTADKLAQQGVDLGTRSAVGGVTSAVQAFGFALPVAGSTWAQTLGLALAGGPVSFAMQQAATREILSRQNYQKLADQYDPFDPVGLTLSTVLPLGFGAIAMRAGRGVRAADAPPVMDAESVDAARTALLAENMTTTRLVPAEDLAGSARHEQAYAQAIDQLAAGGRVDVAGIAPEAGVAAWAQLKARMEPLRAALDEQAAAAPPPRAPLVDETANLQGKPVDETGKLQEPTAAPSKLPIEDPALDARATQLEQTNPNLMVQLEGMDKPVPVSELMARLREEVGQDLAEAPLIQAAAECFLATA